MVSLPFSETLNQSLSALGVHHYRDGSRIVTTSSSRVSDHQLERLAQQAEQGAVCTRLPKDLALQAQVLGLARDHGVKVRPVVNLWAQVSNPLLGPLVELEGDLTKVLTVSAACRSRTITP